MNKFIISGDWHLRQDKPRCRLDEDWIETQRKAVQFVYNTAKEYNAEIIHTGDLFDSSNVSDEIKNLLLEISSKMKIRMYLIAGNHDLKYRNVNNINKSSFGIIWSLTNGLSPFFREASEIAQAAHFKDEIRGNKENKFLVLHKMVFKDVLPFYINDESEGITAKNLLNEFLNVRYVFTGHNHESFIYTEYGENYRYVINPGCLLRQDIKEIDYEPFIIFVDTEKNKIEKIPVFDNVELIEDEYLLCKKEGLERVHAFIESIQKGKEVSLSFEDNLENAINNNKKELGNDCINFIKECLMGVKK